MTNDEVVERFVRGRGEVSHLALYRNLHIDGNCLYSYNMKLALWNRQGICVVDGDSISATTAGHLSILQRALNRLCKEEEFVTIPLSASPGLLDELDIMHIEPDRWETVYREDGTERPVHRLGGATFSWKPYGQEKRKYYLQGFDSDQYFLVELPGRPRSYQHGLELLKPKELRGLEEGRDYLRQGEFFFLPVEENWSDKEWIPSPKRGNPKVYRRVEHRRIGFDITRTGEQIASYYCPGYPGHAGAIHQNLRTRIPLPDGKATAWVNLAVLLGNPRGLPHDVTRCLRWRGKWYVRGTCRHPQHGMLRLGDMKTWHRVYINRARDSRRAAGGID